MLGQKRKILFAVPLASLFTTPVTRVFENQGYDVHQIDYRSLRHAHSLFLVVVAPFVGFFFLTKTSLDLLLNVYILFAVLYIKPSILFVIKGETIQPWLIKVLKKMAVLTVNWYPDDAFQLNRIRLFADHFDLLFTFDPYIKKLLEQEGRRNIHYLPFADEPDKKFHEEDKQFDLVFIGQPDSVREKYLEKVKDMGLFIWGPWEKTSLKNYVQKRCIAEESVRSIYRRAKIVINIHSHSFRSEKDTLTEGTNLRTFMACGVGAFQLVEYRKDLENLFEVGKEIVVFASLDDFYKKVLFYLKRPREMEKIARAGYARVCCEHTYMRRAEKLFTVIASFTKTDKNT